MSSPNQRSRLAAASRKLGWAAQSAVEIKAYAERAKLDEVERTFASFLTNLASAHDFIKVAAQKARHVDWQRSFDELRHVDPLLFYLWKARDADIHTATIVYSAERGRAVEAYMQVVDQAKAARIQSLIGPAVHPQLRLLMFAWEATSMEELAHIMSTGRPPNPVSMEQAGITFSTLHHSLLLAAFEVQISGRMVKVAEPTQHLGKPMAPTLVNALDLALAFYRQKIIDLSSLTGEAL